VYKVYNDAIATTAALRKVATGTAIRTMLQLNTPSDMQIQLVSWGFTIDTAQAGRVELVETDVAATALTAHVASGLQKITDPNAPNSRLTLGTGNTGYMVSGGSAPTEGTTTATRSFDQFETGANNNPFNMVYYYQWMPDERPVVAVSKFLRVRATFGTSTNISCWVGYNQL